MPDALARRQGPRTDPHSRELGFDGLLYYGVDEPRTPEQIERCLREAKRRREQGLPMFTAINSRQRKRPWATW